MTDRFTRRSFLNAGALGAALAAFGGSLPRAFADDDKPKIQGFDDTETNIDPNAEWKPFSDKKLRVGIAGFGVCHLRRSRKSMQVRKDLRIARRDD